MDLKKKTYLALFWSFIDRAGEQVFRFLFSIILARLLLPEQFGLIGMAYVVTEVARIFVLGGFGFALINKKNATEVDECSVFYFNIFISCIAVLSIYILAPYIGKFYKNAALVPIVRVLSLNLFLGAIGTIQAVLMTKNIDFKSQTKVSIPATIISGVLGILLALNNFGVWALVFQNLFRTLLYTVFMWIVHKWRPKLKFSFRSIRQLFSFGSKLLFGNAIQVIFNNVYTILIGRYFSTVALGYYTRAQQTLQLPLDTMWFIIGRVTFPVMSTMKDDPFRMRKTLSKASNNIAFVIFPALILGAIFAPGLFHIVFGERWTSSVVLFQILCLASLFMPLEQIRYSAIISKGNTGVQFNLLFVKYSSTLLSIFVTYTYGLKMLLVGFIIVSYLNFLLTIVFTKRELGYSIKSQIADLCLPMICAIGAGAVVFSISLWLPNKSIYGMLIHVTVGCSTYLLFCFLFKVEAFSDNVALLNAFLKNKPSSVVTSN